MADEKKEPLYTKGQLIQSTRYRPYRDALAVVLVDGKQYTHEAVKAELDRFFAQPVKEQANRKE